MKKLVAISLCSLVLVAGSVAYATGGSLIGKKVDKTVSVVVNGQKAKTEAVIIDGVTYAPVRTVGEMTGSTVKYEGGVVKVDSKKEMIIPETTGQLNSLNQRIDQAKREIDGNNATIATANEMLGKYKAHYEKEKLFESTGIKYEDSEDYKRGLAEIEKSKGAIERVGKELADLERQKSELTAK
ncbi:hypothetical protein [Paenibacillus taiwanensis]|uniref:hypothetical protein n=1 Tax=Paenibacillus taiwanensis TaxID=401638 RepID=UPI0004014C9E|nr:hypothetical protein [Paenibacillus taiwanensis]